MKNCPFPRPLRFPFACLINTSHWLSLLTHFKKETKHLSFCSGCCCALHGRGGGEAVWSAGVGRTARLTHCPGDSLHPESVPAGKLHAVFRVSVNIIHCMCKYEICGCQGSAFLGWIHGSFYNFSPVSLGCVSSLQVGTQRPGVLEWATRAGRALCRVSTELETWLSLRAWRQRPVLTPGSGIHAWLLPPWWQPECSLWPSSSGKQLVSWGPNGSGKCSGQMSAVPPNTDATTRSSLESKGPSEIFPG